MLLRSEWPDDLIHWDRKLFELAAIGTVAAENIAGSLKQRMQAVQGGLFRHRLHPSMIEWRCERAIRKSAWC